MLQSNPRVLIGSVAVAAIAVGVMSCAGLPPGALAQGLTAGAVTVTVAVMVRRARPTATRDDRMMQSCAEFFRTNGRFPSDTELAVVASLTGVESPVRSCIVPFVVSGR